MGDALHDFTVRVNLLNLLKLMGMLHPKASLFQLNSAYPAACRLNVSMLVLQRTNHSEVVLSVRFPGTVLANVYQASRYIIHH